MYNILFITKWYPNSNDPQNGVFVKKHALAIARYCRVNLIYIESCKQKNRDICITHTSTGNFNEFIVQFRKSDYALINFISYLFSFLKAYKYVLKNFGGKPAIVHAHILLRTAAIAFLLKLIYNIPYLITEHWTGFASGAYTKKNKLHKLITQYVVSRSYCVTTVSEHLRDDMTRCALTANYEIIPNIVDYPPQSSGAFSPKNEAAAVMLTAADLVDTKKNISSTIKAIGELIKSGKEMVYHIVGGGEDHSLLVSIATDLGLYNTSVFFHGLQNNEYVYQQLLKCDFVIINSRVETFSVFAAEALICGKPVIATICGGPEEFITPETGILIEKDNEKQLKDAILLMIENYSKFNSVQLVKYASSKFGAADIGKQFVLIYSQILKQA